MQHWTVELVSSSVCSNARESCGKKIVQDLSIAGVEFGCLFQQLCKSPDCVTLKNRHIIESSTFCSLSYACIFVSSAQGNKFNVSSRSAKHMQDAWLLVSLRIPLSSLKA